MRQGSLPLVCWVLIVVTLAFGGAQVWAAEMKIAFHIPAGPAQDSLAQYFEQSRVTLLYRADDVRGVKTQAVSGDLVPSEALATLLQGTGLSYRFESEISAVVKRTTAPYADNTSFSGEGVTVPPDRNAYHEVKLQEVLVTGSLIHGVEEIPSPLMLLDKRELKRASYATVQDATRALPVAASITRGEVYAGTGNFARGSSINLRGLGDGATLVLVDGRRQPLAGIQGDFVDVSNIPWSMVDHIEVLPDGGSALYGSDAIAGVVNIILRQNIEGAETQVRYGTARGGAAETMIAQLFGRNWDSGHWLLGYQYSNRGALAAADRRFTASADKRALGGSDFRRFTSNPGNILDPQTLQPAFAIPYGQDGRSLTASGLLPGVINYQNQFADIELLPSVHTHNVYFTASQDLREDIALFTEGRFGERDFHMRPWTPLLNPVVVPASNPFFVDPFGGSRFVVVAYDGSKDFGSYVGGGRTRNYSGTLGLKSEFNQSWKASLAFSYVREALNGSDHGQVDPFGLNKALADPDPATAFNPFGDGSHTNPVTLGVTQLRYLYNTTSNISSLQFLADGSLFELPSGMVKAAIGSEYREEDLDVYVRTEPSYSQFVIRSQLDRTITAAFTEFSVPLIGDPLKLHAVPKLELSLSGRFEHYSDFGRTLNPKVGLRWTPLTAVKLRASWGSSFKAPNLIDLYDVNNTSAMVSFVDPRAPTGRSNIMYALGGNADLHEERAITWTVGLDLAPPALSGFQLSLTGFSIDYKDQVISPGPANPRDILLQEDQWASVITRNPSQSQIDAFCSTTRYVPDPAQCRTISPAVLIDLRKHNLATTKVNGLDLSLNQVLDTPIGHFDIGVIGTYVFDFQRAFTKTAPAIEVVNTVNNPLRLRLRGVLEWQQHNEQQAGFAANLTTNYTGGYEDPSSTVRSNIDALTTFDLGFKYRIGQRGGWIDETELALNIVNVFNEDPPFVDREWGYDIVNARPEGRVIGVSVSKRW